MARGKILIGLSLLLAILLVSCQQPFGSERSPVDANSVAGPTRTRGPTATPTRAATATPVRLPNPPVPVEGSYFGPSLDMDGLDPPGQVDKFTAETGKAPSIVLTFQLFTQPISPTVYLEIARRGTLPMLTIEPRYVRLGPDARNGVPLVDIVNGLHDEEFRQRAREIRDLRIPMLFRFGHEMNGDWFSWDGARNGGSTTNGYGDPKKPDGPEVFVDAWRHIHDIFKEEGVVNASWVFCPNVRVNLTPYLMEDWNHWRNYYPGDGYVDWVALDGYNWGTSQAWGGAWQSFDQIFKTDYQELVKMTDKPAMIAEFSTTSVGGDKSGWILDAYSKIKTKMPRIKAVVWLWQQGETDWQFDTTLATLSAFQQAVSDPHYLTGQPSLTRAP